MVDCSEIVKSVVENLHVTIQENKAEIIVDSLPKIKGKALHITQLFQNLIGNAIKFHSDQPSKIHISVKEKRNEWLFSIIDNGIGIDEKYSEKIFVIFQRLHSRTAYGGTGIGLAICKKIIEQDGGKIWFESEIGKGTIFYFTIKKL